MSHKDEDMEDIESDQARATAYNAVVVKCVNEDCGLEGEERVAAYPIVGFDMHVEGTIVCACGMHMETV